MQFGSPNECTYIYNTYYMYIAFHSLGKLYYIFVTQRASEPTTALYIIFHQHIFLEISRFTCQTTFWCDIVWHRWNSHMSVIRAPVLPSFLAWRMVQHISAIPEEKARTGSQRVLPKRDPPIIHPAPSLLQDTSGLHCTSKSASEASSKDPSNLQRNTKVEVILKKCVSTVFCADVPKTNTQNSFQLVNVEYTWTNTSQSTPKLYNLNSNLTQFNILPQGLKFLLICCTSFRFLRRSQNFGVCLWVFRFRHLGMVFSSLYLGFLDISQNDSWCISLQLVLETKKQRVSLADKRIHPKFSAPITIVLQSLWGYLACPPHVLK